MKTKLIKTNQEIYDFAKVYETLSGNQVLDLTYLMNAKVRAFYSKNDEIVAGYAISTVERNASLRYLDFLGTESRVQISKNGVELHDFVEITFTFISKFRVGLFENMLVLIYSIFDALKENKRYVMGGGALPRFNARMRNVLRRILFEGNLTVFGQYKNFQILYEQSSDVIPNLVKAFIKESLALFIKKIKN